jgi:hypothetical protein
MPWGTRTISFRTKFRGRRVQKSAFFAKNLSFLSVGIVRFVLVLELQPSAAQFEGGTKVARCLRRPRLPAEYWALAEVHCGTPSAGESSRQVRMELSWTALDGSTLIAESSSCLVTVGGKPAVMLVLRDITGQRRADAERRAQQAALEQQMIGRTDELRQALADARLADLRPRMLSWPTSATNCARRLSGMIGLVDLSH